LSVERALCLLASSAGSSVRAGRTLGPARLDPHRLARHLRGAKPESAVQSGKSAGGARAKVGGLSGEFSRPRSALGTAARATTTSIHGGHARCRTRPDRAALGFCGGGPGRSDLVRSALLRRSWCGPTDRSSESMRAAWLLRLVLVWSARPPGFVTGAGRFPPRLGRPQREARSRPCGRARPGVPARPVAAGRRGRRGARSDPAGRDAPARSARWDRRSWPTTRARPAAR
jgi:hypothetical protein